MIESFVWQVRQLRLYIPKVNVHLHQELFIRERRCVGRASIAVGRRGATLAVVAVSSQFIVKSA